MSGSLTTVQLASLRGRLEQKSAVGRLIQAAGRSTLTASLDDQPALEGYRGHGVFTFAMLDALARGDRNGDGLLQVTELIQHIDDLVPEITFKMWHTRQISQSQFQGTNFALAKQLASLTPAPGEPIIISTTPTHVNVELLQVFKEAGGHGAIDLTMRTAADPLASAAARPLLVRACFSAVRSGDSPHDRASNDVAP